MTGASARYGRGTAGIATAAVAALSASALAGLVWIGADQVLGRGGAGSGLLGDLGLAPAQVDLGHVAVTRPLRPAPPAAPASPVLRTALSQGSTGRAPAALQPLPAPGVPPSTAGSGQGNGGNGNGGNGNGGNGNGGQGNGGNGNGGQGSGPLGHGHGDGSLFPPGHRWAVQLVLAEQADLAAAIAADVPGLGTAVADDSPRSDRARARAADRVAWAVARAERKGLLPSGTQASGPSARSVDATTSSRQVRVSVVSSHASGSGPASVPGHATHGSSHGHPAQGGTGAHHGGGGNGAGHGAGTGDGGSTGPGHGHGGGYVGKHRRG